MVIHLHHVITKYRDQLQQQDNTNISIAENFLQSVDFDRTSITTETLKEEKNNASLPPKLFERVTEAHRN